MKRPGEREFTEALGDASAQLVRAVLSEADSRALAVYAVGGPVRDLLLERPLRDVDLVVEGEGAEDLAHAAAPTDARVTRHDRFGTVLLRTAGASVDLATTRRETYAHPGVLPRVEPGGLEDDLRRRDFSVNALALPLSAAARARHPRIVEIDEGLRDLDRRQLCVLHAQSFHDDPTRILRAARIAPRLGFSLTRGSRSALRGALRDGAFGRVSGDRLRRELIKIFDDAQMGLDPARSLRLLSDWHVLGALEPGLQFTSEVVVPIRRLGRAVSKPLWLAGRWRSWVSALQVWLAPSEPALRRRVLQRFSVRGDLAQRISRFSKARKGWITALSRVRGRGAIDAVLTPLSEEDLHSLHATADSAVRRRIVRYGSEDRGRKLPIDGEDLIAMGLDGPAVGRALMRIRAAYLDGVVRNQEEAIALAQEIARRRERAGAKKRKSKSRRSRAGCSIRRDRA